MSDSLPTSSDVQQPRAEVRAGRKLKTAAAKSGKQKKTSAPLPRRFSQPVIQKAFPAATGAHVAPASAPYGAQYVSVLSQPVVGVSRSASLGQPLGPCFECGKLGHFRKCPLLQSSANASLSEQCDSIVMQVTVVMDKNNNAVIIVQLFTGLQLHESFIVVIHVCLPFRFHLDPTGLSRFPLTVSISC